MNSCQNLPIILRYEEDGSIIAHCPLLPELQSKSTSRTQVIRTMQQLIKHALASDTEAQKSQKYEVVHLAIAHATDTVDRFSKRASRKAPESPRIEIL